MIAGLLVRVIGLLYRPVMKANIGELGYAYYGYAYNVYFILLLISGYSIDVYKRQDTGKVWNRCSHLQKKRLPG